MSVFYILKFSLKRVFCLSSQRSWEHPILLPVIKCFCKKKYNGFLLSNRQHCEYVLEIYHQGDMMYVVNWKCDPILIGSLRKENGFFPAYHMNKASWITVALDGSVPDEQIKMLLDMSYNATTAKIKKKETF